MLILTFFAKILKKGFQKEVDNYGYFKYYT